MTPMHSSDQSPSAAWVGLAAVLMLLAGVLGHDPWKPDEAFSFGIVYEYLLGQHWVIPMLAGEPFMEKPPLYFLSAAWCARLFSPWLAWHEGARLASVLWSALTLMAVWQSARLIAARPAQALLAPMLLAGTLGFFSNTHHLLTDNALFAGIALSLWGLTLSARGQWGIAGVVLGLGCGVGFMSKGLITPGVIGFSSLSLLLFKPWRSWGYLRCLVTALLVASPFLTFWPYQLWQHAPHLFDVWFWENNVGRFLGRNNLGPTSEPGFYLKTLPWLTFPAGALALVTLFQQGRTLSRALLPALMMLGVMMVVLGQAKQAMSLYAVPTLIPLSILGAQCRWSSRVEPMLRTVLVVVFGGLTCGLIGVWLAYLLGQSDIVQLAQRHAPGFVPAWQWQGWLVAGIWLLGAVVCYRQYRHVVVAWALGLAVLQSVLLGLWLPFWDYQKSYRQPFAAMVQAMHGSSACVASWQLGEHQRGSLHYFTGIRVQRLELGRGADCPWILVEGPLLPPPVEGADLVWTGRRPGDDREQYRLFARPIP